LFTEREEERMLCYTGGGRGSDGEMSREGTKIPSLILEGKGESQGHI